MRHCCHRLWSFRLILLRSNVLQLPLDAPQLVLDTNHLLVGVAAQAFFRGGPEVPDLLFHGLGDQLNQGVHPLLQLLDFFCLSGQSLCSGC